MLGVCAWVWSSVISVDEWVVSSYFGQRPISVSRFKNKKRNKIYVCWVEQERGR